MNPITKPFVRTIIILAATAISVHMQAQGLVLQPLTSFGTNGDGSIRPGERAYLTDTAYQRGLAYNPMTGNLILVNRFPLGSETIQIISGTDGADVGLLQGFFPVAAGHADFAMNLVGVGDDGSIYVCNLTTETQPAEPIAPQLALYRWENEADTAPDLIYFGDPSAGDWLPRANRRWGDTMTVRGSGINTEILMSSRGNLVAIFRPNDASMMAFGSTALEVPGADALGYAVTFGAGNTFYVKGASADGVPLFHVSYNLTTATATVLHEYAREMFPGRVGAMLAIPSSNLLAAIEMTAGSADDLAALYDLSAPADPPALLDRRPFFSTNANNIFAGAVTYGTNESVYMLDTANGIVAYSLASGTAELAPRVFQNPLSRVIQVTSNVVFTVGADGSSPLAYQWQKDAAEIAGATSSSYSIESAAMADQATYTVVVTNTFGSVTSAPALLTVLPRFGDLLVYDPFAYAPGEKLESYGWIRTSSLENGEVEAGNLSTPGLAPSYGNRYTVTASTSIRIPFGEYSSGSVYCSFLYRLDDAGTGTSSETTAGFSYGTTTVFPLKVNIIGDGSGNYQFGLYKRGGTTFGAVDNTHTFTSADTVFIVARYTYITNAANDDTCEMWVNPDPNTFGASEPPTPTVGPIGDGQTDDPFIDRFFIRFSASAYPKRTFDEVRIGFSWAEVTPQLPPTLSITPDGANVRLSWSTNFTGFTLKSIPAFDDPDGWQTVETTPVIQGPNYVVPVSAGGAATFFRLEK